ncbi:STE3-domain-containing protein [Panus rudis PR-1116 ss-1]|nr:STE3-domain-containing protein [Panus rudis PR-1116 ss-1]
MVSWAVRQGLMTAFSFIGFVLVSIPLYWHMEAWNVGCVLYILWTAVACLINFINLNVWRNTAVNMAPGWCDFSIRMTFVAPIGIIAAAMVISRRLCKIATGNTVTSTRRDKRRAIMIDLAIGLAPPLAQFIIFFFIQGHRFDIFEGIGCQPAVPNTILFMVLYGCWPIAMGLVSAFYCVMTLRAFIRRRKQFSELIASNSNLTFNRYFRLMAMAVIEMLSTVPLGIYTIVGNVQIGIYQWKGFADLHSGFDRVRQFPLAFWQETWDDASKRSLEFNQWAFVVCALVFFLIFGMAEEAKKHYRAAYTSVAKRVGLSTGAIESSGFGFSQSKESKFTSSGFGRVTIPTFIQRNASKRDSLTSFSVSCWIFIGLEYILELARRQGSEGI